eukprot:m.337763 g.337763  ORF g.337763 m.337763 type:complete len:300 (+) comp16533_c3_seq36:2942-3841(+)
MQLRMDLSHNPLEHFDVSPLLQQAGLHFSASFTSTIALLLNNSTRDLNFSETIDFTGIPWNPATGGTLNLSFAGNPRVQPSVVRALSTAPNSPAFLHINLSWNNYSMLAAGVFDGSRASSIDLSHNSITHIAFDAVDYNFDLISLRLSFNRLTTLTTAFLNRLPGLKSLLVDHNELLALPATNNHLAAFTSGSHNPLQCAFYGPRRKLLMPHRILRQQFFWLRPLHTNVERLPSKHALERTRQQQRTLVNVRSWFSSSALLCQQYLPSHHRMFDLFGVNRQASVPGAGATCRRRGHSHD